MKNVAISNRHCVDGFWFEFRHGEETLCSLKRFRPAAGAPSLLFNGYRGSFQGVQCSGSEVDEPPLSSSEDKND